MNDMECLKSQQNQKIYISLNSFLSFISILDYSLLIKVVVGL